VCVRMLHVHKYSRACVRMYREASSWKGTYIDDIKKRTDLSGPTPSIELRLQLL